MRVKITLLLFVFFLLSIYKTSAQLSNKHYIPPLTYAGEGNSTPEEQFFYISTPSTANVSYTITQVGSNADITGVVSKSSPQIISIGSGETQLFVNPDITSTIHTDKGYIIESSGGQIYVSVRAMAGNSAQAGALVSKGSSALGQVFRAGMYTNENPQSNYLNFISVMATENNTRVNFSGIPAGILIKNFSGGNTIPEITLNEGESYVIATRADETVENRDGLIGTLIQADKNIVVNTGSANGSFHNGNARDYGIDQIVGADKIGSEYIFVKGGGENGWENVLIVAHENNTEIRINGSTTAAATINSGEYFLIEGNEYSSDDNMYVETSNDVFAYQGIGANTSEANQGMFFVPPLSCESRGNVDYIAAIEQIGGITFDGGITVVTNTGANIEINGQPIGSFNTVGPNTVTGNANYVTYKVTGLSGDISVTSDQELYCAYFNQNGAASSGSFYSGFVTAPEINFNTTVATLGNCVPNVTLEAANTSLFDSFEWQWFNGSTNDWETRSTNSSYSPIVSEPGRYRLIGIVNCTNARFESVEIPVSLCPDDLDGDLIIDNLDVDLDNDGILNCDESLGDANLDLSDTDNPNIVFQDNSTDSSTITASKTSTLAASTVTGSANGDFVTTLAPDGGNSDLLYQLDFTQNVNIKFQQSNASANNSDVTFIVKIGPNSKNLTLLNPNGELLIDSNFDGDFESGINNISASEIRFKFDSAYTGTSGSYQFVANQVNQFSLEIKSNGLTASSSFNGNLILTCFDRDSDGDGILDARDFDSDNDGIPDFFESVGQNNITLLGTDANLDGLDDVFNTVSSNLDSDGDGIPNYLDLDSDNDGIYDLIESGFTLTDANNDGIIDNATIANAGMNGLLDSLENPADSGTLLSELRNSDENSSIPANRDNLFDFVDIDADGDDCFDVTEAGFTDANFDGILDANPFDVDNNGKVINNTDGYTTPNSDYLTSAPITITNFSDVTFCEANTEIMSIDTDADAFQWQLSTDNGTNWSDLVDDTVYNGVNTKDLQITNTPASFNNYQFRVLLSKNGNACTDQESNAINLTVNTLPVIKNNPADIFQCIASNDNNPTVNLTTAESNISDTPNLTFEYYSDSAGANRINNETSYPVQVNTVETVFVKVISDQGCSDGLVELRINIGETADNGYNAIQPPVCDDLLDANGNNTPGMNDDTDFISNFSLDKNTIEAGINPPANTQIFYYESSTDRNNNVNEIDITNYRNDINKIDITNIPEGIQFPIYYKMVSTINNDCQGLGEFYLQIHSVPEATVVSDIEQCDDEASGNSTDGRNININLRDKVNEILGNQNPADYSVTFHTTQNGATNNTDIITNDTDYTNQVPTGFTVGDISEQTIYVRVEELTGNRCYNANTSFKIRILPVPALPTSVTDLIACDTDTDPRNRVTQNIDLRAKEPEILMGRSNLDITYFISQQDAESNTNPITNPSNYQNSTDPNITSFPSDFNGDDPAIQTIFYVISDQSGLQCSSNFATFRVLIYPEPFVNPITVLSECDNNDDGDDTNGIIQTIDLNGKIPEILGPNRNSNDYQVTFYSSQSDAIAGLPSTALPSPYTNSNRTETIHVRVQQNNSACFNAKQSFNLEINSLPDFSVTTPQILCLNDLPLTIEVENPGDVYAYQWKDSSGNVLGANTSLDVSQAGIYTVVATDNVTFCTREETIEINQSNVATLDASFVTIVDESNNLSNQSNLSISIDTINNDLGPGDYQFAILNTDTNTRTPFIGYQDEPLFQNLEGGIYQIIVNDKNGCTPDTTLLVSVVQFPKFFTPNGDGQNDTWEVKGANKTFYPNSSITIFNRYGKLVAQFDIDDTGWNGTYNGTQLPSDDYWYNITLVPSDNSKPTINKKGNFSLLRR